MRERSLGFLSSFSIQGKTLFAINERWNEFLGDTPTFEVIINKDGRYTMVGPVVYRDRRPDPTMVQKDNHV